MLLAVLGGAWGIGCAWGLLAVLGQVVGRGEGDHGAAEVGWDSGRLGGGMAGDMVPSLRPGRAVLI